MYHFNLSDFIFSNKEELRNDIKLDVQKFLAKETIFDGLFHFVFKKHYELFIIQQLKLILLKDFAYGFTDNLTFDSICDTLDVDYLKELTNDYFFDRKFYET
jgi:hypothetical protein